MTAEAPSGFAHLVTAISEGIATRMLSFGMMLSPREISPLVAAWLIQSAATARASVRDHVDQLGGIDVVVETVTVTMLGELAEERPGTDPWEHERLIPLPVAVVTMIGFSLTMVVNAAKEAQATMWLDRALADLAGLNEMATEQLMSGQDEQRETSLLVSGRRVPFYGPTIKAPQPAVAHMARVMTSVAHRLRTAQWSLPEAVAGRERSEAEGFADTLDSTADLLRDLNAQFGRSGSASRLS